MVVLRPNSTALKYIKYKNNNFNKNDTGKDKKFTRFWYKYLGSLKKNIVPGSSYFTNATKIP